MHPAIRKLERTKGVIRVVLFGSAVKGKAAPGDIDVLAIVRNKGVPLPKLGKGFHVVRIEPAELLGHSLFRTILLEGRLPNGRQFSSEAAGLSQKVLYLYDLRNLAGTGKSRFAHALFGRRKGEGLLDRLNGERLGSGAVSVPPAGDLPLLEFFKGWKVGFSRKQILGRM